MCIIVINNMYGYNAMEVQEAFVKIKEQARAYLTLPHDLTAGEGELGIKCSLGGLATGPLLEAAAPARICLALIHSSFYASSKVGARRTISFAFSVLCACGRALRWVWDGQWCLLHLSRCTFVMRMARSFARLLCNARLNVTRPLLRCCLFVRPGLNMLNTTNLDYFSPQHQADIFRYGGRSGAA